MVHESVKVQPRERPQQCPLCRDPLRLDARTRECPGCRTQYHAECLDEMGGCSTLGCARKKRTTRVVPRPAATPTARGSTQRLGVPEPSVQGVQPQSPLGILWERFSVGHAIAGAVVGGGIAALITEGGNDTWVNYFLAVVAFLFFTLGAAYGQGSFWKWLLSRRGRRW